MQEARRDQPGLSFVVTIPLAVDSTFTYHSHTRAVQVPRRGAIGSIVAFPVLDASYVILEGLSMASVLNTRDEVYLAAGSILEQLFEDRRGSETATHQRGHTVNTMVEIAANAAHYLVEQCKEAAAKIDAKPEESPIESVKPAVKFSEFVASLDCVKSQDWLEKIHPLPWKLDLDEDGDADTITDTNGKTVFHAMRSYPTAFLQWLCDTVNGGPEPVVKPVELRTGGIFDKYPLPWRGCKEGDNCGDEIFDANGNKVLELSPEYDCAYCQQIADIVNGPAAAHAAVKDDWKWRAYAKMAERSERWRITVEYDRPANRHGARIDTAATADGHFVAYASTAQGAVRAVLAAFLVADLDDRKRGLSGLRELNGQQQKAARELLKG